MKRVILYILIVLFFASTGCGVHKVQKRHMKHSRKFNKRIAKKRSKQYKRLRHRPSINQRSSTRKLKIKKYGGTYIIK
ncbi:MAG: hypothetical protein WCK02_16250 [Bacteroidota bacterium]